MGFIELYFLCSGGVWILIAVFFSFMNALIGSDDPINASQIQRDIAYGRATFPQRILMFFVTLAGSANPLYMMTALGVALPVTGIVYFIISIT